MAERFAVPGTHEAAQLAHRIWHLDRAATRLRYRRLGVPIVQWKPGEPLGPALAGGRQLERWNRWLRV
jgi:hypothetical protein